MSYIRERAPHIIFVVSMRVERKSKKTNMQVSLLEYIRGYTFTRATNSAGPQTVVACQKSIHRTVEAINSHQYARV